ncbi:transcription factor E2F2 isoform X2 [Chrysoperla carnea]|uniref:transcription factor E2F2 isoform X2 n=1 Tax=Chrysoperla carnea TaxID=189513 RepID=UPI001D0951A3|nr:transcription factor E2F2 isoform X2 [Chrysoperla carnea]
MPRGVRRAAYLGTNNSEAVSSPRQIRHLTLASTPDMSVTKLPLNTPNSGTILTTSSPMYITTEQDYGTTPQHQIMRDIPMLPSKPTEAVKRRLNLESDIRDEFKTPPPKQKKTKVMIKRPQERTRYDTSLGLLTKKFVLLLQQSQNGVVDLNRASVQLEVQKRRIYDITNVLEGIGILEKKSKNNIQWKCGQMRHDGPSAQQLQQEIADLDEKENTLKSLISDCEVGLRQLSEDRKLAYITYQDLRCIPGFQGRTVMAIKAPPEAKLEVPQPTNKNKYQITLRSENGEIEVFLCSNNNNDHHSSKQIPSHIPICDPQLLSGPENNSVLNPLRPILTPSRVRRNLIFKNCTPQSNIFATPISHANAISNTIQQNIKTEPGLLKHSVPFESTFTTSPFLSDQSTSQHHSSSSSRLKHQQPTIKYEADESTSSTIITKSLLSSIQDDYTASTSSCVSQMSSHITDDIELTPLPEISLDKVDFIYAGIKFNLDFQGQ